MAKEKKLLSRHKTPPLRPVQDFRKNLIALFGLAGFAIAQPLYDLLGRYPEFLVVHRAGPGTITLLILTLSVGMPVLLLAIETALVWITARRWPYVHHFIVAILVGLILVPLLMGAGGLPELVGVGLAVILSVAAVIAYARFENVRLFVRFLGGAAVVFPLYLLFFTPVNHLVFARSPVASEVRDTNPVPIFLIVFDELNPASLVDGQREIDVVRFPNFAAFARDSYWFSKATGVSGSTTEAVPTILAGLYPRGKIPTAATLPDNLFTWLGGTYEFNVSEPITQLCPVAFCPDSGNGGTTHFLPLLSDVAVVYAHTVLPRYIADSTLPTIANTWKDFRRPIEMGPKIVRRYNASVVEGRDRQFVRFIRNIDSGAERSLNFLHIAIPHMPLEFMPSGKRYFEFPIDDMNSKGIWGDNSGLITLHWQRHLLQVGFADTLLGIFLKRLKQLGLYERSLIIVTADHGVSFTPGHKRRSIDEANYPDILHVPMFVRLPGQVRSDVLEHHVTSTDIVPTIADVIGAPIPWPVDGVSMLAKDFPARPVLELGEEVYDAAKATSFSILARQMANFGAATPSDQIVVRGPRHGAVAGRALADFDIGLAADVSLLVDRAVSFSDIQAKNPYVPAFFLGVLKTDDASRASFDIAIAVNGTVRMTTRTFRYQTQPHFFAVVIPEGFLQAGNNSVEAYVIENDNTLFRISQISKIKMFSTN